jgi:hypothetical protein
MFGEISGFFSVRHICNAREAQAQTGPYDVSAQNSRNLEASFSIARCRWLLNSVDYQHAPRFLMKS